MVDLSSVLPDEDLRRRYGTPTLDRAWDYVRRGKVLSCSHELDAEGDLDITGEVAGSTSAPYAVRLSVGVDGEGVWVVGRCSCPVRDGCKHCLALLITVRDEHARSTPDHGRRWERQLATLLEELDVRAERAASRPGKPLALQVDLKAPTPSGGYRGWSKEVALPGRGTLRVRPLQRGARDNWVRTGVSWTDVPYLDQRGHPPEQVAALNDLLSAHRAATRQMYFGADAHLTLGTFGPNEVALLARAVEAGVPLLAGAGLGEIHLEDPVTMQLDVNAAPDRDARLRLGVALGDSWYGPTDLDVLGERGCTVALWEPEGDRWSVALASLTTPAGPEVRRLLRQGDSVVVPAGDRDDLVAEYLPRLHRHVPVTSSDGSVQLPETIEPRLALTVTWVAVDEVRAEWSWRYRVGLDDRVYTLTETRGRRGVRRPEAEQALVDALVLDEEQVHHLCRSQRRDAGLADARTFRDADAILFAEHLLPGLRGQVEVDEIGDQPDYRELEGVPLIHFVTREGSETDPQRTDWLDLEVEVTVDGVHIALAHVLAALTQGSDRVILRTGRHLAHRPAGVRPPGPPGRGGRRAPGPARRGCAHRAPRPGAVGRAGGGRHRRRAGGPLGPLRPGAAHARDAAAGGAGRARGRPALLPVRRLPVAGLPLGGAGWAGSWPTTWGWARPCRRWPWSRTRGTVAAAPFLVVAPTSVVSTWAGEAAAFTPGLVVRVVTESQARRGATVAELRPGRRPGGHLLHALPPRAVRLRRADLGRARARRGPDGQEPPGQDLPGGPSPRGAVPAGADRDADGEPPDGPVVAALHRRARALPVAPALHRDRGPPGRAARRRRGAGAVPAPDPPVPAAPHQGPGRRRPARQAGAGARRAR